MRLRDDDVRFQLAQLLAINAVDGQPFLHDRLDALVDLVAGAIGIELRFGTDRQTLDRRRVVAFVRTSDDLVLEAERETISVALAMRETIRGIEKPRFRPPLAT